MKKKQSPKLLELNDATVNALRGELCKDSLYYFVLYFWDTIISDKYIDNWHVKAICDELQPHLERALKGEKKECDIVVNISPGTTKSTIISQMLPAWAWARQPESIILTSTNSDKLTAKNAMRSKDIINSDKFKTLYPDITIRKDASAKTFYQNGSGGARYSFTTKGSKIGNHGNILIEDDPTTAKQAKSKVEMEAAKEGFKAFQTRKTNKESSLYILLMQRLSPNDYTDYALKKLDNVLHICLPAEDSELVKPEKYREKYVDSLLDPVRLSREILASEKRKLNDDEEGTTEDDYDAQYGQDPKTKKGLVYDLKYFDREEFNDEDSISLAVGDIADSGTDYLSVPFGKVKGNFVYIHDAVFTNEGSDITAPYLVGKTKEHGTIRLVCETNAMGATYINLLRNIGAVGVKGVPTTSNKITRIIATSWIVNQHFRFARTGSPEYMKFLNQVKGFLKTDTVADDGPDSLSLFAKYIETNYGHILK